MWFNVFNTNLITQLNLKFEVEVLCKHLQIELLVSTHTAFDISALGMCVYKAKLFSLLICSYVMLLLGDTIELESVCMCVHWSFSPLCPFYRIFLRVVSSGTQSESRDSASCPTRKISSRVSREGIVDWLHFFAHVIF